MISTTDVCMTRQNKPEATSPIKVSGAPRFDLAVASLMGLSSRHLFEVNA